jgi:Domain of unknown function (DUF5666)
MRRTLILVFALSLAAWAQTGAPPQPNRPMQGGERGRRPGVGGTITAISNDALTLKTFDERTVTVKLTSDTRFRKDQQDAKLSDFKVGDVVMVRGEKTGEDSYTAAAVMSRSGMGMGMSPEQLREKMGKEIIAGEIKSIDGLKLTIAQPDGQTQTIAVDETTSFRKQGESVTLADLKPGDRVFGRGQLKDGVFVPSVLNIGPPGGMRWGQQGTPPQGTGPQGPPPEQQK